MDISKIFQVIQNHPLIFIFFFFGNLVTIWAGIRLGDRLRFNIHIPYIILKSWRSIRRGDRLDFILDINYYCDDPEIIQKMDRALYRIHGIYKNIQITSNKKDSLGKPDQFNHKHKIDKAGMEKIFLKIFRNIGSVKKQNEVIRLLSLWGPYIKYNYSSQLIEVIQTSILVILGYDIPFEWRENSFKIIRSNFMRPFVYNGTIDKDIIFDMIRVQEYLIPRGQAYKAFMLDENQALSDYKNNRRQDHKNEQIAKLLRNTRQLFNKYSADSNLGGN